LAAGIWAKANDARQHKRAVRMVVFLEDVLTISFVRFSEGRFINEEGQQKLFLL
jgi:hypothetical protein